ncbi:conserved hypothetical protein [Burkholderia ambifaria MEX-5]|uniref:Phage tail protein n=2 Tax=Burkholderia ambifaria TaxID=152480 RepID=B1T4F2_9BURK|nr:conserved hypothetical protein [Burkholderia ambifaria MEX-5]
MAKTPFTVMSGLFESGLAYLRNGYADVQIILMDGRSQPTCFWYVRDAMPTRWDAGDLDANSNTVLIETLELTYRWIRQIPVKL